MAVPWLSGDDGDGRLGDRDPGWNGSGAWRLHLQRQPRAPGTNRYDQYPDRRSYKGGIWIRRVDRASVTANFGPGKENRRPRRCCSRPWTEADGASDWRKIRRS